MSKSISRKSQGLIRQLGLFDSITTGIMAQALPSPGLILLAWVVGGLITLSGALTYAELGAAMPLAGGQYIYLREAFGPLPGFLFGWILFLVTMSGSIAALGVAFAEYFGYFFPPLSTEVNFYSIGISLFNKSFNYTLSMGQIVAVVVVILLSASLPIISGERKVDNKKAWP